MQVPCDEGVGAAKLAALNVAYKEREKRGVIKLNLVSLALTWRLARLWCSTRRIGPNDVHSPVQIVFREDRLADNPHRARK